jgi:DEAD/DEAH box helicase domain-containing protein
VDTQGFLDHLSRRGGYRGQIAHVEHHPDRPARNVPTPDGLHSLLSAALDVRGLSNLYSHQAEAIEAASRGESVIVASGPASGKSLCYNIPVLDAYLNAPGKARALYIFPTKALAQDQLRALKELTEPLPKRPVFDTYDGDTESDDRARIRRSADIVLTNPEMLHLGILPNHRQWSRLFRGLQFVVIDEAHAYRGVFGSHLAMVLRRLKRIARIYGSDPQFVLTSATLGNPKEHAEALTGLPSTAITEDGAPTGGRDFVLWNPPIIDDARSSRRSAMREGSEIFTQAVGSGTRTLTFVRSRQAAELVYRYTRDDLTKEGSPFAKRVSPYRAGYVAQERREIERAFVDGELIGVVATNAMELGIDIGDLDAAILIGYPGSLAATFQQAGRAGRRGERALAVLVVSDNPLEQYVVRHPDILFRRGVEFALVSTTNPHILGPHLVCAAYETPLSAKDAGVLCEASLFDATLRAMEREGVLLRRESAVSGARWHASPAVGYPAESVHLRSISGETYALVEEDSGRLLETVGEPDAFSNAHPGAVYLHRGEEFVVRELDLVSRTATLAPASNLPYFTQSMDDTDLRVREARLTTTVGSTEASIGAVDMSRAVIGYRRKRHDTNEVLGIEYVDLPAREFETEAVWWTVPQIIVAELRQRGMDAAGGLHAFEHAAIGLLPLFALCDRWDIGGLSTSKHPDTGEATIFIYDGHPGGVGIAERGFEILRDLWEATHQLLIECPCEDGCPSCIQSPKCGNNNEPLDKAAAKMILERLLATQGLETATHNEATVDEYRIPN